MNTSNWNVALFIAYILFIGSRLMEEDWLWHGVLKPPASPLIQKATPPNSPIKSSTTQEWNVQIHEPTGAILTEITIHACIYLSV